MKRKRPSKRVTALSNPRRSKRPPPIPTRRVLLSGGKAAARIVQVEPKQRSVTIGTDRYFPTGQQSSSGLPVWSSVINLEDES